MKVLLLQHVQKVGKKDEVVEVSDGYAAHALFPKKLAVPATKAAVEARDRRRMGAAMEREVRHTLLAKTVESLRETSLMMNVKANPQGNLFSKIRTQDIISFLAQSHHITLDPSVIVLPEIKKLGTYTVEIKDGSYSSSFDITLTN